MGSITRYQEVTVPLDKLVALHAIAPAPRPVYDGADCIWHGDGSGRAHVDVGTWNVLAAAFDNLDALDEEREGADE